MSRITQGLLADEKELKMGKKDWEGSAADTAQDRKLAKKHGMSMTDWEKSSMDTKHDTQQSSKGLRGGGIAVKGKGIALKKGGKVGKYAIGGMTTPALPGGGMGMPAGGTPMNPNGVNVTTAMRSGRGIGGGFTGGRGGLRPVGGGEGAGPPPMRGGLRPVGGGEDAGPPMRLPMKKGGAVKEADSGEMYASKAAMKRHEAKESPEMEKTEHKRGGGIAVKGKGIALKKGGSVSKRGGGIATRGMGIALKGGGRAKGCM